MVSKNEKYAFVMNVYESYSVVHSPHSSLHYNLMKQIYRCEVNQGLAINQYSNFLIVFLFFLAAYDYEFPCVGVTSTIRIRRAKQKRTKT